MKSPINYLDKLIELNHVKEMIRKAANEWDAAEVEELNEYAWQLENEIEDAM